MNADEIVRELRCVQEKHRNDRLLTFQTDVSAMARDAADMIESLQSQHKQAAMNYQQKCRDVVELEAQLTEKDLEMEVLEGRAENQREYLMSLRRQLIASTHREKAAVNFIKYLDRNYSGYMAEDEKFEQWRCPQEVEKGETNA